MPVLIPPEVLAACSKAWLGRVVVVAPKRPSVRVVVGRSEELVVGLGPPATSVVVVVDVARRKMVVGDDRPPELAPAVVVGLRPESLPDPELVVVDLGASVVGLAAIVVVVESTSVVVELALVVVVGSEGRVTSWAPAGARAIPASTIVTRHTTAAARCRTPTQGHGRSWALPLVSGARPRGPSPDGAALERGAVAGAGTAP